MKKTNFTLLSKTFKMCAVLLAFGFYSISSTAQCPAFNPAANLTIQSPAIVCGDLGPNMLANPGFEDQVIGNGGELAVEGPGGRPALSGWNAIGVGEFGWGTNMFIQNNRQPAARNTNNLKIFFNAQAYQDFPAVPGETFVASIYKQHFSGDRITDFNFSELHIEYQDAAGCLLGTTAAPVETFSTSEQFNINTPFDEWIQYTTASVAPPGTVTARFVVLHFNPGGGGAGFYDDATFQKVITPPTAIDLCSAGAQLPVLTYPTITDGSDAVVDVTGTLTGPTTASYVAVDENGDRSVPCEVDVQIVGTGAPNGVMACNDLVNISIIDMDGGCSLVSADAILEGDYGCFEQYEVVRVHDLLGNCSPADAPIGFFWVSCEDVGTTITLKVIDPVSGNYCWGDANVEDKEQPTLECDVTYTDAEGNDQVGTVFNLTCSEDPNGIDLPEPVDNCDLSRNMNVNLISETSTGDLCSVVTITKVYQTSDRHGNLSNTCTHTINIEQPAVTFPDDITWTCEQYAFNNGVVGAAALHPAIIENAAAMDLARVCCDFPVTGDDVVGVAPYMNTPVNSLTNGGFETGDLTDWVNNNGCGDNTQIFTGTFNNGFGDVSPTEGNSFLVNEFNNPAGNPCATVTLRQGISVPATGSPELTFDYNAAWDLTCPGCLPKLVFFEVIEIGVGLVSQQTIVNAIPGTTQQGAWQSFSFDLTPYLGKNIEFQFVQALAPGAGLPGHFALDNFQLFTGSTSPYWLDTEDLDVTLDPRYDDNIDNPRTDNDPLCGTVTTERDNATRPYNLSLDVGCPYLTTCDVNPGGHLPELVQVPIYQSSSSADGLEDADILELTGSGQPNVVGTNCKFAVTHVDQLLEACDGVSTDATFKIIRTWTVLNWCTGLTTTDVQIIKVVDQKAPEFAYPVDQNGSSTYSTTLLSNQSTGSGNHAECYTSGLIPPPLVTDNCSGVAELRVFTPVGEGVAVRNNNGDVVGYSIPSPFLPEGDHDIIFQAIDGCGNSARDTVEFEVIDGTPPTPICREITQISVSSEADGLAEINAEDFDEGSYDYCGPVYFKVRRMDDNCSGFTNDRRRFNDDIRFCCDDIGETVMVVLRVYDVNPGAGSVTTSRNEDNANDCMIEVLVEDKVRPECYAPADVWINCDELPDNIDYTDDAALDALFGTATVLDNCAADLQYVSTRESLDLCGVGNVTRTFRAEDAYGNRSVGSCRQVIMVQPVINYCITVPEDYEGECDNNNAPDDLTFVENGCDLLAVSTEEEPFNAGGPAGDECRKVIRTWKVINWCEYDGIAGPTVISRDGNGDGRIDDGEYCSTGSALVYTPNPTQIQYASTGYYEWKQHVKIFDNTAPEVSYDGAVKFCGGDLDEDPCTGQVDIELEITELCTDEITTTWAISAFSSSFSSTDINGSGSISTRLPLGTHTVRFSVTDDCGNTAQMDITFSVVDCKAPTPVCHNGLSIDVMPLSGMVELWANDFDASSFDYCSDFTLRANVVEDLNGDGIITSDDYVRVLPADDFIVVDCDDVANGLTMVQLWVAELDGTADDACADNQDNDFCVTFVEVQDNNGVCSSSRVAVGGKITNEDNEAVENVTIEVNAGASMLNSVVTDATGEYEFLLPTGGDISITPMRNDDVANGVSTFDLVLVSKHILNVSLLDSPYKMLAADANRSGSISTLDLVAIRKVVLRLTNEFPNNTSWRFVEKSHIFTSNNPWASSIPELMNINNLTVNELNTNFTAIKVGDVNGDSKANGILGVDDRSFNGNFEFRVEDQNFKAGEEVAVTFSSEDLQTVDGYQFTLKFNEKALELVSIENGVSTAENFGTAMANNGFITTSWNGTATDNEAFTVIFNAKAAGTLSNEIAVSSALTNAEAYVGVDYKNVSINFGGDVASNEFTLYQNTPNPFKGETVIGFDLPTASSATLTVSDVSGKILKVVSGDFAKGHNNVTLSSDELSTGVLYYQLDTEGFTKTMKMVVIK